MPTLEKLEFIADRLGTKIADLLEGNDIQLPDDYWELKGQIVKFPTYADKERLQQKQELIEEIYDKYFDILPEDELLFFRFVREYPETVFMKKTFLTLRRFTTMPLSKSSKRRPLPLMTIFT